MNSAGNESFLGRWSRRKLKGADPSETRAADSAAKPVMPLPDPETLQFGDDFSAFLGQHVEERVRRTALKKLFHSTEFNVMDGLDTYIDDYGIPDPIDAATLGGLLKALDRVSADVAPDEEAAPSPASEPAVETPVSVPCAAGCAEEAAPAERMTHVVA